MPLGYAETANRAHWLLDLEIGGVQYRFASSSVEVMTEAGETLTYEEGLSAPSISLVQDGAAESSAAITISSRDDWARIEARGYSLDRAAGVLRRWWEGTTLERARVYLRGLTSEAEYGGRGDPLTLTLSRSPVTSARSMLDPQMLIYGRTWPVRATYATDPGVSGAAYPLVIGCPGSHPSDRIPKAAIPALMVEYRAATLASRVLLGIGHIHASTVRTYNLTADPPVSEDNAVIHDADGLLQDVSLAEFSSFGGVFSASATEYWYGLQADSVYGGGMPNPYTPGTYLRGASDVIRWVLDTFTDIRVDHARMATYAPWLNQFHVDSYLNTPINAFEWLTASVLAWLPVVALGSAEGLYFAPVRWDATAADAQAFLSVERGDITRETPVSRLSQPIYNEITVRYRPQVTGGKWHTTHTLTADRGALSPPPQPGVVIKRPTATPSDDRVAGSYLARMSQAVYGVRPYTIDIHHTWSDTTAQLIAQMLLDRHAWPKRTATYSAGPELEALLPGSVVAISDAEIYLDEALAYVVDVSTAGRSVRLDLILLDHPVTRSSVL